MKAAIFKGKTNIDIDDIEKPQILDLKDAIVKNLYISICGSDLHMYHGKIPFEKNHILGHEFVGIVEEVGSEVQSVKPGDKVIGLSSMACGDCFYCRMQLYSQCENANPNSDSTAFFGSPKEGGSFQGAQAEYIRVPFADMVLYKIPEGINDKQAITLSDILPTGYFGAEMAEIKQGETVAIYGAGPIGQMAGISAKLMGASRVIFIDHIKKRLQMAKEYSGAEIINYKKTDPVDEIMKLTDNKGVDKVIEAVGLEAETDMTEALEEALNFEKSSGRSLRWAINSVRKGGVVSIIGVFAGDVDNFPIGAIQSRNITLRAGNCPHKKYIEQLVNYVKEGKLEPSFVITQEFSLSDIKRAYQVFDKDKEGCVKELILV